MHQALILCEQKIITQREIWGFEILKQITK